MADDAIYEDVTLGRVLHGPSEIAAFVTNDLALGGHFAHVHDEAIDPKHDDAAGEAWLHGRFSCVLYRRPPESR